MLDPQASRFWQSTLLSGLLDASELAACWDALPPGKREAAEHLDRRLARQAVHSKALTLWQAQQLLAGRTTGYKVDRYILLDLIGQGGMGRVYLAQDSRLSRRVALKILSPERVNNPRAIARFQREARVGAQLQHENLVRIYDFGESNGRYYLVMEFIEGRTIGTMISEVAIPPAPAARLVRQVALGLEHAHRKGLIHRDVNPYNILVTRDGTAKLADLGLAIDLAEEDRVTREGATVGTFDYVAPEQARHSHSADIRSDIYSLGCTLYHMCSGQVPFPTPSLPEKLFAHQAMEPEPLDKLVSGLPEGLAEVVQKMMHKSPDERYATPLQVAVALQPFCDDHQEGESGENEGLVSARTAAESSPPSVSINEGKTGVQTGAGTVKAVTPSATLKTPSGIEGETPTERGGSGSVSSLLSTDGDAHPSDPDFPLGVDLGPEPSLGEALSRPKSRPGSHDPVTFVGGKGGVAALPRQWLWGLAAVTTTVMILVVVLAMINPGGTSGGSANQPPLALRQNDPSQTKPEHGTGPDTGDTPSSPDEEWPIVIRTDDGIEKPFRRSQLREAIDHAIGNGSIELRNRKPLHLTSDQQLDLTSAQGKLTIRAADGVEPVLEISLKNAKPFLMTGASVRLKLSGVTIAVHYPDSGVANAPAPPAVITAAGNTEIDRCAFKTMDARVKASCAVLSNGGLLKVDRCWFEGFDKAIEIDAQNTARTVIQQTMIVPESCKDHAQADLAESYGWGVKLKFVGAPRAATTNLSPHLTLKHCTVEGGGLIDLTGWKGPGQVQAEVNFCAVRTNALLAVNPKTPPAQQILWRGEGDQYDVQGHSWIVHSASAESPAFSNEITDLTSWLNSFATESNPIKQKVLYRVDPAARSTPLRPRDFALDPRPGQVQTGADPDDVGPWSNLRSQPAVTVKK
jgi:serine/threonine protein kinase